MSVKRSRPGSHAVRTGKNVGPDYPAGNFDNPLNTGCEESKFGNERDKAVFSEQGTTFDGGGAPLSKTDYDELYEGK